MEINQKFGVLADDAAIGRAVATLGEHGIEAVVVASGAEAKAKALEIIPAGAEVMTMTSVTLSTLGLDKELNESGRYNPVRGMFKKMDPKTQGEEMRKLGAASDWVIGSVHAVTETGSVLIASQTGSQLPAYAYGAGHVLWVVGAQKIVKDYEEGVKRLYEYSLPKENDRAKVAYGTGSAVNKMLVINKEVQKGRITMIIVKENLGF